MARLKSPSLKQLGLVPYNFPNRVEDHTFTQQVQVEENVHDPAILAEVWRVTRQAMRVDKLQEVPFNQSFSTAQLSNIRSSTTFVKDDVPIISAEIRRYIAQQIKFSLWGYITNDPRLTKYLIAGSPGGISAPIRVDVEAEDRLVIKIQGPFWLQFYFTGAVGHRIFGHNPRARNMLVFYGRSGDKIVTPSVYIPEIKPGLYIERAIADTLTRLESISSREVSKKLKESEENDSLLNMLAQGRAYLAAEQKWVGRQLALSQDRAFFLNIQQQLAEAARELTHLAGDMRRRRQLIEPELKDDATGEAPRLYGFHRDLMTHKLITDDLGPNPDYKGRGRANKRGAMLDAYHTALDRYLTNYVTLMQLTGATESRVRDIILPEHNARKDYKLPSRQQVNKAVKQLRDMGVKIKRRRKAI